VCQNKQVAQLSQRDRAAGCVSFGQKWENGTGIRYFADIIGLSSTTVTRSACKAIEFGEKTQNKGYYAVQGHSSIFKVTEVGTNRKPYATSLTLTDILSHTVSKLSRIFCSNVEHFTFSSHPIGGGLRQRTMFMLGSLDSVVNLGYYTISVK